MKRLSLLAALPALLLALPAVRAAAPFTVDDGERIVFLGNTLIEREQRHAYWETALTRHFPKNKMIFRNLGWSGDTVFGHARAGFGNTAHGFKQLKEHVLSVNPHIIFIAYGANESFEGPDGLPNFIKGYTKLLDALAPAKARLVLLSPLRQENLGPPLPNPTAQNKNLRLYADAIRDIARTKKHLFLDLYDLLGGGAKATPPAPLTNNGLHPTPWGYWRSAFALKKELVLYEVPWRIDVGEGKASSTGCRVEKLTNAPLRFSVTDDLLPAPPAPTAGAPKKAMRLGERTLRVKGLAAGQHTLTIDGKEVATASAAEWAKGVRLERGPDFDQVEKLRKAIVAKNQLYFHRWRPQNETYLFGFRKHEQGKNAREIPMFDPLVVAKEKEIALLRVPVTRTYELKPSAR